MVFPHNIASEKILDALRTYNFLATINSSNVPRDGVRPQDLFFALRPTTILWANFPSISRYSAEVPNSTGLIAVGDFLDNPLIFYCHQDLFADGIGAFDAVADQVNTVAPGTLWRGLGEITKHLYLVKLRNDSDYDVLAFSRSLSVDNTSTRDAIFYVHKEETGLREAFSVLIDGQSCRFRLAGGYLDFNISVPAGQTRNVAILFKNDLELAAYKGSRQSLRVYFLRTASDFRDITMSRYAPGRALIDYYYKGKITRLLVILLVLAVIMSLGLSGWVLRVILEKPSSTTHKDQLRT